ncbi:MAG: hypothetical protein NZ750_06915 [Anaerolineae bacterium]|nr:hypothetical protein [Anaerolineae bacterium]MDW8172032.1 hypothetical protein [Anaerolineae bacterium]
MRYCHIWIGLRLWPLTLLVLSVGLSQGQSAACPFFAAQAIDELRARCAELSAGQGCTEDGVFNLSETPLVNLIDSEMTAPLALLSLNASLSEGRRIDLLLYGGVALRAIQSEAPSPVTMQATNAAGYAVNLRRGPGTNFAEVGVLPDKASLVADGRSADSQWVRVRGGFGTAWVAARLVRLDGQIGALPVAEAGPSYDEPFQQAILSLDEAQEACDWQASGLLVRNPHQAQARLLLNGLALEFGPSAFIVRADPEAGLILSVLQGSVQAALEGQSASANARQSLRAPLGDDSLAQGTLERADWVAEVVQSAPLALFDLSAPQAAQAPTTAPRSTPRLGAPVFVHSFLAPQTVIYQADSGPDVLSGTCNTPPIEACSHPAAITPNADGTISWRGQEPVPYRMQPVGPNTFVYRGRNVLNNARLSLELTLTSESTWSMTMTTVYDNDPLCNHTYYYTAVRR